MPWDFRFDEWKREWEDSRIDMAFQGGRTGVVSSFPYTDIAQGKSEKIYYCGTASGANIISSNTFYSDEITVSGAALATNSMVLGIDFDITFLRPVMIRGPSIVNVTIIRAVSAGTTKTITASALVKIRKWDGTTETDIITENSTIKSDSLIGEHRGDTVAVSLDIPKTKFKAGETLRLRIELWGYASSTGSNVVIGFAHDPKNRVATPDATVPTRLTFEVPYVVDI